MDCNMNHGMNCGVNRNMSRNTNCNMNHNMGRNTNCNMNRNMVGNTNHNMNRNSMNCGMNRNTNNRNMGEHRMGKDMMQNKPGCGCSKKEGCDRGTEPVDRMAPGMAFVPWQKWEDVYCMEKGLERGTIFEQLDKPFLGGRGK